jgi:hypothetical protein
VDERHRAGGAAELEKLAAELDGTTYAVTLETVEGRRPCLSITNRQAVQLTEFIYAAPADDDEWWFWWGWAQRIVPVADLPPRQPRSTGCCRSSG